MPSKCLLINVRQLFSVLEITTGDQTVREKETPRSRRSDHFAKGSPTEKTPLVVSHHRRSQIGFESHRRRYWVGFEEENFER
jgi:hypothetical protein